MMFKPCPCGEDRCIVELDAGVVVADSEAHANRSLADPDAIELRRDQPQAHQRPGYTAVDGLVDAAIRGHVANLRILEIEDQRVVVPVDLEARDRRRRLPTVGGEPELLEADVDAVRVLRIHPDRLRVAGAALAAFQVRVGDKVLFSSYSGNEVTVDGKEFLIMTEDDVLAVVD